MQRSGVYAELRWGNQALRDGGHRCLIGSAILPTSGTKQGAIHAGIGRAWSEYQCWRRGRDLMSRQAVWAPWHLTVSEMQGMRPGTSSILPRSTGWELFSSGQSEALPLLQDEGSRCQRASSGWLATVGTFVTVPCECSGGNQTPSALCRPIRSQICKTTALLLHIWPPSCAYGHIYGKNVILQVHSLLGPGARTCHRS